MSLKIIAELSCDSCGKTLSDCHNKSTELDWPYHRVKSSALKTGWVILLRGGIPKHFCDKCAEKVVAKKFTSFSSEELLARRTARARRKHRRATMKEQKWWSEELFQSEKWKYGLL